MYVGLQSVFELERQQSDIFVLATTMQATVGGIATLRVLLEGKLQ